MSKIIDVLYFLRLVDDQRRLSMTNLLLIFSTVALFRCTGVAETASFVATLAGYQFKRWMQPEVGSETELAELQSAVASLQTKVTAITMTGRPPK